MAIHVRSSGATLRPELIKEETMRAIADLAIEEIASRTDSEKDHHGVTFKPYSPRYAAWKAKYRSGGKGITAGNVNQVDLKLSGEMLNSMSVVELSRNRAVVSFSIAAAMEKAMYHCITGAGVNRVIRDFFAVSSDFCDRAIERVNAAIKF